MEYFQVGRGEHNKTLERQRVMEAEERLLTQSQGNN